MRKILAISAYILTLFTLVYLGIWQMQRLEWKEKLIAEVLSQKDKPAAFLPQKPTEFFKARIKGTLQNDNQTHYYIVVPKPKGAFGGQGYFVITPVKLEDGRIVLLNRGFIPMEKMPFKESETLVDVEGVVRFSEKRSTFSAVDDVKKRIFYVRDSAAIYAALGIKGEDIFIDQTSSNKSPLPQSNEAVYSLPNNHLDYALTWFGLALTMLVISGIYAFKRRVK
jgi:surfeit locus 1 family protein